MSIIYTISQGPNSHLQIGYSVQPTDKKRPKEKQQILPLKRLEPEHVD